MSSSNHQKTTSALIVGLVFIVIIVAGYYTISDLAGKQSQQHQQSISPVFSLIEQELIAPLQIASTLSNAGIYDEYFLSDAPKQDELIEKLDTYSKKFGLEFYLAHDKSRKQYNSDGRVFDLVEGEVIWYFALKNETDSEVQAVLGKRENPHLYIDVRQYDEEGEFIGFVGVGKSLQDFLSSFESFRNQYGHEFVFVNNKNEIQLSSVQDLSPEQADSQDGRIGIKSIDDIAWHEEFTEKSKGSIEPSVIVNSEEGDLLVSQLNLESLNWSLYILTPLNIRQQEVNQSFTIYIMIGVILFFVAYVLLQKLLETYIDKYYRRIHRDPLTKLANREYAGVYFTKMRKNHRQMAVIMADLDNFKEINDQHGHRTGDEVLKVISDRLRKVIGNKGLVVRWGGEEFAIILPAHDFDEAEMLAQSCRKALLTSDISCDNIQIKMTASFGLFASRFYSDNLEKMIETADIAMYKAKESGKNKVCNPSKVTNEHNSGNHNSGNRNSGNRNSGNIVQKKAG